MVTRIWMAVGTVSILALGLMAGPQQATALDCSARPVAGGKEPWVYRTVEGKKCWYRGTKVIPKAELHWPVSASAELRDAQASLLPAILPASTNDERHPQIQQPDMQADTFEARWRGLPR
jgi:hypothetical protein